MLLCFPQGWGGEARHNVMLAPTQEVMKLCIAQALLLPARVGHSLLTNSAGEGDQSDQTLLSTEIAALEINAIHALLCPLNGIIYSEYSIAPSAASCCHWSIPHCISQCKANSFYRKGIWDLKVKEEKEKGDNLSKPDSSKVYLEYIVTKGLSNWKWEALLLEVLHGHGSWKWEYSRTFWLHLHLKIKQVEDCPLELRPA